jgi:hypothetical protein
VATENAGLSPLLPLAAGIIIALFTISLAIAEPRSAPVIAAHDATVGLGLGDGGLESDALVPSDTVISSRPLHPPRYPDRYEFYHRYDYGLTSRYRPTESTR